MSWFFGTYERLAKTQSNLEKDRTGYDPYSKQGQRPCYNKRVSSCSQQRVPRHTPSIALDTWGISPQHTQSAVTRTDSCGEIVPVRWVLTPPIEVSALAILRLHSERRGIPCSFFSLLTFSWFGSFFPSVVLHICQCLAPGPVILPAMTFMFSSWPPAIRTVRTFVDSCSAQKSIHGEEVSMKFGTFGKGTRRV